MNIRMEGLPIQPLLASMAALPVAQRQQQEQNAKRTARERLQRRASSSTGEELDRLVESPEEAISSADNDRREGQKQKREPKHSGDDAEPADGGHIDLQA